MTTPWLDEAALPPDRQVVDVHLPEEIEMSDEERPAVMVGDWYRHRTSLARVRVVHVDGDQVQLQRHDNGRVRWSTAAALAARYRRTDAPWPPTPPAQTPAGAPTPPHPPTTHPSPPDSASGPVGGAGLAEATLDEAIKAAERASWPGLPPGISAEEAHRRTVAGTRAAWEVFTARHAAEVAQLRTTIADYERRITWDTTCKGCADRLDDRYDLETAAEQRGREQAAQAIEAPGSLLCTCDESESAPTSGGVAIDHHCDCPAVLAAGQILGDINMTRHYAVQCIHNPAARRATPTPAGGEAGSRTWEWRADAPSDVRAVVADNGTRFVRFPGVTGYVWRMVFDDGSIGEARLSWLDLLEHCGRLTEATELTATPAPPAEEPAPAEGGAE